MRVTDFCIKKSEQAQLAPTWWAEMDAKVVQMVLSCVIQNHFVPFQSRLYQRFQAFLNRKFRNRCHRLR